MPGELSTKITCESAPAAAASGAKIERPGPISTRFPSLGNPSRRRGTRNLALSEAKKFHEIIYHASRNSFLAETCANLRNRVFPYLRYQLHRPGRAKTCLAEQQLIADAILARDPETAARSSRDHLRVQQRVFSEFMTALENTGMAAAQFDWVSQKISQLWAARD